ncbi:MAG: carbohydrate-binding family 9-like protein [Bacteroidia bacterium]|nr:carbohydrate-binding family 9-like protein [Bacteroidia bacterium]NNM15795.1 carbohydrate-binding family 9-like protein [Bacteroidia bacterium]
MPKILLLSILFFLFSTYSFSQSDEFVIDVSNELVQPKHYIVSKTSNAITMDGLANETDWQNAKFSDSFIDIEGIKKPKYDTKMKMLWNEEYLYVYAELEEPHVWGNLKQRDTIIFYNNDFEIFLDPSGDTRNYGEIEINALGTVWDLLLDKPYRVGGKANNHWNLDDLQYAIHINGTLNDPSDIDSYWTVEMAIPLKALIELRNKPRTIPKEGEQWKVNFSRVHWDHDVTDGVYSRKIENGNFLREYNWVFSNQGKINMHEPEKWATLQFTHQATGSKVEFIEDEDALVKQIAYALFRKARFDKKSALKEFKAGDKLDINVKYGMNAFMESTFIKTNFGFEFVLNSEESGKTYIINEEGNLKVL